MTELLPLAAALGLASLLTPCVLPMLPITVGLLGGSGHGRTSSLVAALAHGLGIVATYAVVGLVVTLVGATGVVRAASNPWLNVAFALLFVAFALSLFGLWELRLPAWSAARALPGTERRAPSAALALGAGVAFALVSLSCTAPFVGTLLVLAARGDVAGPLVALVVYATAFALPFVLLALAPSLVARLPRPGAWMLTLRAMLGVAELALAVKFLSNADLVLRTGLLPREAVIALWIAAAIAVALLATGVVRHPHDERPRRLASLPAVAALVFALGFGAYVASGVRDVRLGSLDAYLPPPGSGLLVAGDVATLGAEPAWMVNDLDGALAQARLTGRPVLVDFSGYTCANCRWMEANVFPRRELRGPLDDVVRVRLYTDGIGSVYERNLRYQFERFATISLPYYAILRPDGSVVSTFGGMTRDASEFGGFVREGTLRAAK